MAKRNSNGQFLKGTVPNPKGRPKESVAQITLRRAIKEGAADIVESMLKQAKAGDVQAAKLLLDRSLPTLKPTGQTLELPGLASDNLSDRAKATLDAVARGEVTPDDASTIINSVAGLARITELAEIEARIAALEEQDHD